MTSPTAQAPPGSDKLDATVLKIAGVVVLGAIMSILDVTVVSIALPTFMRVFSAQYSTVAWTMTGYTLALAAVIPVTGWAADRFGTKRLYLLALLLFVAGREAMAGRLSAGGFVALMLAMMAIIPSLKQLTNVQNMLQRGVASAERLFGVLDAPDEVDTGTLPMPRAKGLIEFRNVGARYAGQTEPALQGISFDARPGTVTAIVGRSGSGKSTLVKLIPRFYDIESGRILLDGHPLDEYRLADLRRQIALVGQQVMLFDGSIADNVAYGEMAAADPQSLERAVRGANAMEFVERLPEGLQSAIGANGGRLSGGQRQRVAIARAMLKDAPILILDEATAALDTESERLVQDALEKLMPDRTTLVIAHRLSTIEHADQVLVLDHGRLVEQGTHAELLARGGLYAHLHQMQFREPAGA
jgi:subfamily B ATP-binding cassette protein MsbA